MNADTFQSPLDPDLEAFTMTLRNAAKDESDPNVMYALKGAADTLDKAIDDLADYRNAAAMIELNGAWSYAVRVLNIHREPKQPQPPQSAHAETATLRKAA